MANKRGYIIEKDSRGRQRIVIPSSSSHHRTRSHDKSTRELLDEAEEREQSLISQVSSLQTRLSFAEQNEWHFQNLRRQHQTVVNEHINCRNTQAHLEAEVRKFEDYLEDEEEKSAKLTAKNHKLEDKNEKLEEKIRLLKRGIQQEDYRARYDEKVRETDLLRTRYEEKSREADLLRVRLAEHASTIRDKVTTIVYLKDYLRSRGFRVAD